ncbi:hypothetical protein IAT40_003014 [Kwoniella sp. CBS 6097]
MPPKKSIFRGPEAQHFQLVHRSQQDPRINDPEASQRVFKSVTRGNDSGRKPEITLADLENSVDKSAIRKNEGEAAMYGITYDDSSYDYMAHLKPVGDGGVFESVMIAAPRGGSAVARGMKATGKGKGKAKDDDVFGLLPEDVLPSKEQLSVYEAQTRGEAIPAELQGLQPDMDPHLRQVLEALDDDAFVDEDGDEDGDWFGELVGEGEREEDVEVPWQFKEWGEDEGQAKAKAGMADGEIEVEGQPKEETWEDRFKAFKRQQDALPDEVSDIDPEERSEMADTVGTLMSNFDDMMVVGGKKRRGKRGPSDASGMSMSSSSMFRTQGLRDLDDRFDKVEMDYLYDDDEEEEYEDFPDDDTASVAASNFSVSSRFSLASHANRAGTGGPPEVSRDDFEAIMDDFLDNYEVVGRRLRPALGGTGLTGTEKLSVLRSAIEGEDEAKEENRRRIMRIEEEDREKMKNRDKTKKTKEEKVKVAAEPEEEKWDVQTILTTYTNTENHPAMIRSRTAAQAKARAEALAKQQQEQEKEGQDEESDGDDNGSDSGSDTEREGPKVTVARQKGETTEDKKARKAAVKAERSARRAEKKSHKETFSIERKRQLASHKKLVSNGRAADVAVGARGVVSLS